ncbi:hypothetical protein K7711_38330 [Nocardia sp. CA2R105]|uniref:aKG-HExxH-type peptide beta-hydroxylase n=1 Tax=Nocardia coffeae TaxID=2873381 RepID=UPI001CA69766|nr:HEXXH motif-containing putative peptide modification protein [Nocardia coffeae]MBY8862382.1 hypothetical protein [Nocardia coffeae]
MDELTGIFRYQRTTDLHRARARSICTVLSGLDARDRSETATSAMDYALAHHFLEGVELAARSGDGDTLSWYRTHPTSIPPHWFTPTPIGPTIVQCPDPTTLLRSPLADTPYHLLGPSTEPASSRAAELVATAFDIAAEHGFGDLIANHSPIVCLLIERRLDEPLNSWAISRLPGTVFLDHVGDPTILARDLVHEAGHNWLNDALAAAGIGLDDGKTWNSPWKNTHRPTFGFLHSCWAFPLTMLFAARAIGRVPEVLATYLAQHRQKLATTDADHDCALAAITDIELRERLRMVHALAQRG